MGFHIERIDRLPDDINSLISESKAEGFNFLERLNTEFRSGENTYSLCGEALYSCYKNDKLIGIGGVNNQSNSQGRIRRFYISSQYRRLGEGSRLLHEIESNAFEQFNELVLYTDTLKGAQFYEHHGYFAVTSPNFSHRKYL